MYTHTCRICGNMFNTQISTITMCSMCYNTEQAADRQYSGGYGGGGGGSLIEASTIIKWFFLGGGLMFFGAAFGIDSIIALGTKVISFPFVFIVFIYFLVTGDFTKAMEIMHKFLSSW